MAKLTLTDLSNIPGNPTSAANTINSNSAAIEAAIENTLSRDGTSPNQMLADFDMNSYKILNLPEPSSNTEPLRLMDIGLIGDGDSIYAHAVRYDTDQNLTEEEKETARNNIGVVDASVNTIEELQNLTAEADDLAFLGAEGREGHFRFDSSDLSALVDIDTVQGVYIAPASDTTGANGAWVRVRDSAYEFNVVWFGATAVKTAATGSDISPILQIIADLIEALAPTSAPSERNTFIVHIPAGRYLAYSRVTFSVHGVVVRGQGIAATQIDCRNSTTGFIRFRHPDYLDGSGLERCGLEDLYIMRSSDLAYSEHDIGVEFLSVSHGYVKGVRIANFSHNLELAACGSPFHVLGCEFWQNNELLTTNQSDHIRLTTINHDYPGPAAGGQASDLEPATLSYTGAGGFTIGSIVTAGTSGTKGEVFHDTGSVLYLDHVGFPLDFDAQTADFHVGRRLTGDESGATADIEYITDGGLTGTLYLSNVQGTFQDNEIITESGSSPGSATVNGTIRTFQIGEAISDTATGAGTVSSTLSLGTLRSHGSAIHIASCHFRSIDGASRSNIFIQSLDGLFVSNCHFGTATYQVLIDPPGCKNPLGNTLFNNVHFDGRAGDTTNGLRMPAKGYVPVNNAIELQVYGAKFDNQDEAFIDIRNQDVKIAEFLGGHVKEVGELDGIYIKGGHPRGTFRIHDYRFREDGTPSRSMIHIDATGDSLFQNIIVDGCEFHHGGDSTNLPDSHIRVSGNPTFASDISLIGNKYVYSGTKPNGDLTTATDGFLVVTDNADGNLQIHQTGNVCLTAPVSPQVLETTNILACDTHARVIHITGLAGNTDFGLSTDRAHEGDEFEILHLPGDNFLANIGTGPLIKLSAGTRCVVRFFEGAWILAGYSAIDATKLRLIDTNATHHLELAAGSNLTAARTLTLTTGDQNVALDFSDGDFTVASGTWTPVLTAATPGSMSVTYSTQAGFYYRLGKIVVVGFSVATSALSLTGASGSLRITGLPFTSANTTNMNHSGSCTFSGVTFAAAHTQLTPRVLLNASQITFTASGSGVASGTLAITETANPLNLTGQIIYRIS